MSEERHTAEADRNIILARKAEDQGEGSLLAQPRPMVSFHNTTTMEPGGGGGGGGDTDVAGKCLVPWSGQPQANHTEILHCDTTFQSSLYSTASIIQRSC